MLWLMALLGSLWPGPACEAPFCDCVAAGSVAEAREGAAAVFAGTVVGIRDIVVAFGGHEHGMRAVTLRVDRAWKGVDAETVTVVTGWGGGDCGFPFELREPYLVYATRWAGQPAAPLATGICGRTALLRRAADDLRELGEPLRTSAKRRPPERVWLNHLDAETEGQSS
jgi:hypothetical protein